MELYVEHKSENGKLNWIEYVGKWFVLVKEGKYLHRYNYGNGITPKPSWTSSKKFAMKLQEDGVARNVGELTISEAVKRFGGIAEEVA